MPKPTTELQSTIAKLANDFAARVLDAIRQMSLDQIVATVQPHQVAARRTRRAAPTRAGAAPSTLPRVKPGQRRSSSDFDATISSIIGVLQKQPGLRAEQIRAQLGLSRKDMDRPLAMAIQAGKLRKTGERRATKYFAK